MRGSGGYPSPLCTSASDFRNERTMHFSDLERGTAWRCILELIKARHHYAEQENSVRLIIRLSYTNELK